MGSSVAWRAAAAGLRVVLLERSATPTHATGSSHGHSRIVRRTYLQAHYARLMNLAYPLWDALSQASHCGPLRPYTASDAAPPPLVRHTGGLSLVLQGSAAHADLLAACAAAGIAVSEVQPAEAAQRWGLTLPAGTVVVLEAGDTGCAVGVGRCVGALQGAAAALGACVRLGAEVTGLAAVARAGAGGRRIVEVGLRGAPAVHARKVVLCPGAWAGPLLEGMLGIPPLPLQVLLCSTAYYRLRQGAAGGEAAAAATAASGCPALEALPVLIDWRAEGGRGVYGVPVTAWGEEEEAYSGAIKMAIHDGAPTSAAGRPFTPQAEVTVVPVSAWLAQHAPFIDPTPLEGSITTCLYTMTPDEDFIMDALDLGGEAGLAFVCAGFSGHGFKFAPLVGEIAARWACAALQCDAQAGAHDNATPLRAVEAWLQQATAEAAGGGSKGREGDCEPLLPRFSLSRASLQPGEKKTEIYTSVS